jgi:hypothetical protein
MIIESLLDACEFVLNEQGELQSSFWLASQVMEMKMWRASEANVRDALCKDVAKHGEASRFVTLPDDEWGLRSWAADSRLAAFEALGDSGAGLSEVRVFAAPR